MELLHSSPCPLGHLFACRQAHALLERVAALNEPLRRLLPGSEAATLQLRAACLVLALFSTLHTGLQLHTRAPPERVRQACMRLVLQCGCQALEAAAALPAGVHLSEAALGLLSQ